MERITYRITLDAYKNGIQRTLQGFETADNMARRIAINLTAGGDTIEIPSDHVTAMMYVTTPSATEPSINACEIDGNTVIYDVLPIVEEGITEMQLKLIKTDVDGARGVLAYPRFAVEVTQSNMDDGNAEQTTTFTALEDAVARANAVYDSRLLNIEIDKDCTFRAIFADGTVYENDYLNEALYNGNALLSESWARGGTGARADEDTNNSMYFANVSRSASEDASLIAEDARELLNEASKMTAFTSFIIDFDNGNLEYMSHNASFDVDEASGDLTFELAEDYDPETLVKDVVEEYVDKKSIEIDEKLIEIDEKLNNVDAATLGGNAPSYYASKESVDSLKTNLEEKDSILESRINGVGNNLADTNAYLEWKLKEKATLGDPNVYFPGILLGNTQETNAYIYSDEQNNIWFKFVDGEGQVQYINMTSLYNGLSTTNEAYTMASNALPKSGGTVLGQINTDNSIAVAPDASAFMSAPIVFNAYTSEGGSVRAGCGFHNAGVNGAFLYLGTDNFMHLHMNHGADYRLLTDADWRIIVESAFTVSGDDLILNWL